MDAGDAPEEEEVEEMEGDPSIKFILKAEDELMEDCEGDETHEVDNLVVAFEQVELAKESVIQ